MSLREVQKRKRQESSIRCLSAQHCPGRLGQCFFSISQNVMLCKKGAHCLYLICAPISAGDAAPVAHKVAAAVGISRDSVHAGIKPGGKADLVRQLQDKGCRSVRCLGPFNKVKLNEIGAALEA